MHIYLRDFKINYLKDETDEESQVLVLQENKNKARQPSSSKKLRRSFHKYTGTAISSPIDKRNWEPTQGYY